LTHGNIYIYRATLYDCITMLSLDLYHLEIIGKTANGIYSIRDLVNTLGRSPNTIVKKVDELLESGFLVRIATSRHGGGNSPKVVRPTESGKKLFEILAMGEFRALHKSHNVLAGPILTFSRLGIYFVGKRDLFSLKPIITPFFDVVICRPYMFEKMVEDNDLAYPRIENFIIWTIESANPRFIVTIPLILREVKDLNFEYLKHLAVSRKTINRLNLLLDLTGLKRYVDISLQIHGRTEKMLESGTYSEGKMKALGKKYRVLNVPRWSLFEGAQKLYGKRLKW
jgi:DNA-binding MarR family transcriptional regulator